MPADEATPPVRDDFGFPFAEVHLVDQIENNNTITRIREEDSERKKPEVITAKLVPSHIR